MSILIHLARANVVNDAIIDFEEERSRHAEIFGRMNVLERLRGWLSDEQASSTKWVLLLGSPGVGKSAIVDQLLRTLSVPAAYHLIRRGIENWDRPEAVVQNLCARILRLFPEVAGPEAPSSPNLHEVLQRVSRMCLLPHGRRLIVVIDGLDETAAEGSGANPLLRFLPPNVPAGVVILCASRPMYAHLDWITSREKVRTLDLDRDEWAPSNRAVTRELCLHRADRISPPLTPAEIEAIVRSAQGNVLHASRLCEWADGQPPSQRTPSDIAHGLTDLLRRLWSADLRAPDGGRHELVQKGLGLACAAREALPAYLFGELIGDPAAGDGTELLRAARHFLREEPAPWHDKQAGYRLYHEHFREVILEWVGSAAIREHHRRFLEVLAKWPPAEGDPYRRSYALRHSVAHRLAAGDVPEAQRLSADVTYLGAKCAELDISAVEREMEAVIAASDDEASLDLTALLAALRGEQGRIAAHPKSLPSLIYNRLRCSGWSPERIERLLGEETGGVPVKLMHGVRLGPAVLRDVLAHDKPIVAAVLTPDGRHALTVSADRTARYWALASGDLLAVLQGHTDELTACALTPDGRTAVTTSVDMTARLWDLSTGRCTAVLGNDPRGATACAVSVDGRTIAIGSDDGGIALWDLASRRRTRVLEGHGDYVTACAAVSTVQLVTASRDRSVRVWDIESGECIQHLSEHGAAGFERDWVTAIAPLLEGRQIVAAAGSGALSRWDLSTGRRLQRFGGGHGRVDALAVLHGGSHLSCGMADGSLVVWDLGAERRVLRVEAHKDAVSACAVTPDGRRVLSASSDRRVRLWEIGGPESLVSQDGHSEPVTACVVTPDGRIAVSASEDRLLKVWEVATGECRITLEGHSDIVTCCAISADGRSVLSGARDGGVIVWQIDVGRGESRAESAAPHRGLVSGCAILADGRMITASQDGGLFLRDVRDLARAEALVDDNGPLIGISLASAGTRLLSVSRDGAVELWDLPSQRALSRFVDVTGSLLTGVLTPDGGRVVLGFADGRIEVRDARMRLVRSSVEHGGRVFGCAVSLDGGRVISASEDGTVRVASMETGRCVGVNVGTSWFRCVAATDTLVCAGDQEGNVWLLQVDVLASGAPKPKIEARKGAGLSGEDKVRLRDALARHYPLRDTARGAAFAAGLDETRIHFDGSARDFWLSIVEEASKARKLGALARHALSEYRDDAELYWAVRLLKHE